MPRPSPEEGTLPTPGKYGRTGRFVLGVLAAWVFVLVLLPRFEKPPGQGSPTLLFLAAAAVAIYVLPDVTKLTLSRKWGSRPTVVAVSGVVALGAVDLLAYDRLWAPPLAWYLFLLVEVVFGLAALSLILAAVLAVPG